MSISKKSMTIFQNPAPLKRKSANLGNETTR